ncbi:MAG: hypothetical protein L0Y42_04995 [Phycisphaerales bacterium]|nr:hypothetical protein [Phycisphaerales bacterium]
MLPQEKRARPSPVYRLNGLFLIVGWLAIATIGWFALAKLADNIRKNPEVVIDLPPLAAICINYRAWLPVAAVPALICGIVLLRSTRTRGGAWLPVCSGYALADCLVRAHSL